mmetsp:Transcript_10021/g.13110  ORF Transcript_10021/g.13110 Transcript_10021/m.13110 type:complete len:808 (+) Transcript_10021:69-2492(+)
MELSKSETNFLNACRDGNLSKVINLISAGVNVHVKTNGNGFNGLHWAAKQNHLPIIRFLCGETEIDVNEMQRTGMTALHLASFNGNDQVVRYLVKEAGVDINQTKGGTGSTAVFLCSQLGHIDVLRFLVKYGADVNVPSTRGSTPLHVAAEYAELECVKCLINEGGAKVNIANDDGFTALMKCCGIFGAQPSIERRSSVVKFLLEKAGADVNAKEKNMRTSLHLAAAYGYVEIIEVLLEHGANIDDQDSAGFSPLCDAASRGKKNALRLLLSEGADPTIRGWNGNTFLHLASANGNDPNLIGFILEKINREILPIDSKNFYGYTPLHLAVKSGSIHVVEKLLQEGAAVNERTYLGDTALHIATQSLRENFVECILKHGGDPSSKNFRGQSYLMVAKMLGSSMKLERYEKKLSMTTNDAVTCADFFVRDAKVSISEAIDLQHVLLLHKSKILQSGEIPHYNNCKKQGWHVSANNIKSSEKVLFISHRWGMVGDPDPTKEQYKLLVKYLSRVVEDIDYLWVDFSCICQDKESPLFNCHLTNIPTAIMSCTHMLIIPKLTKIPHTSNIDLYTSVTDLSDYLGRAWCLFESMAGLLTSKIIHLAFQLGEDRSYQTFGQPQSGSSSLGFYQSKILVLNRWKKSDNWLVTDTTKLSEILEFTEPCRILAVLMKIVLEKNGKFKEVAEKVKTMDISLNDILHGQPLLQELWELLGNCFSQDDKVIVMNLTLFMGFYTMRSNGELGINSVFAEHNMKNKKKKHSTVVVKPLKSFSEEMNMSSAPMKMSSCDTPKLDLQNGGEIQIKTKKNRCLIS